LFEGKGNKGIDDRKNVSAEGGAETEKGSANMREEKKRSIFKRGLKQKERAGHIPVVAGGSRKKKVRTKKGQR